MVNFSFGSAVRILPLLAAMLGGIATAGPAVAHPHVWIDLKTEAHIDGEGRFAALTIVWIFDEFYSAFALDGLEKPGGAYKPEDLAALTDVNMTNLEEWNYFAEVTRGGETAKFGKPRDAHSAWDEKSGRLTLTFTLTLTLTLTLTPDSHLRAEHHPLLLHKVTTDPNPNHNPCHNHN